jgi:hypothetical protein
MYTGQVDVVTNTQTWRSLVYDYVDDQNGTITDLTNPALNLVIVVTIKGRSSGSYGDYGSINPSCILATASIANGKVTIPGPGFQWQFEVADLSGLCAGTYGLGVKVTINGFVQDMIDGTIAVIEGNR